MDTSNRTQDGAGLKVERVLIEELTADPANVRKHNAKNLKAIEASLRRFGQQKPIVVDGDGIVRAGNGTLAAAQQLGWKQIDVVRTQLKGAEATAYAIADNRTAELAEWDEEALAQQLAAIQIEDEELVHPSGFDFEEVEKMTGSFNVETIDAPNLAAGDRQHIRQMTFVVHDEQHLVIEEALSRAKKAGHGKSSVNENSNGNALAEICKAYKDD